MSDLRITVQNDQEPVAWQERQAKRMKDGIVTEWSSWYPCRYSTIEEAKAEACDHIPYEWRPLYTHSPCRDWQGLTDPEIIKLAQGVLEKPANDSEPVAWQLAEGIARAAEVILKEKNYGSKY